MKTTVIGAGVVGLSCGFELSQLDHYVTVIDAGAVGAGASAGNAGWVTPFLCTPRAAPGTVADALRSFASRQGPARVRPHLELGFAAWVVQFLRASTTRRNASGTAALQQLSRRVHWSFDRLEERGVSFERHTDGLAVVFKEATNLARYEQLVPHMRALGYVGDAQVYRGPDAAAFDPAIRSDVAGMLHLRTERHVRPETLTQGLAKSLQANGGRVIEHEAVQDIGTGERWVVRTDSGREVVSDNVVLAAGYRTRRLLAPLGVSVPIEVAKGTSMTATGEGTAPSQPLKLYEKMIACSPFHNAVRLSGTYDLGARNKIVNSKRLDMVVRQGLSYLQSWRPTNIEAKWVGHRPTTVDDLPVVGPVPGKAGLYLATGHGTLGVTLGPITGALAAYEIAHGDEEPLLKPFRLTRFRRA